MMECGNRDRETVRHEGKEETLKAAYTLGERRSKRHIPRGESSSGRQACRKRIWTPGISWSM